MITGVVLVALVACQVLFVSACCALIEFSSLVAFVYAHGYCCCAGDDSLSIFLAPVALVYSLSSRIDSGSADCMCVL